MGIINQRTSLGGTTWVPPCRCRKTWFTFQIHQLNYRKMRVANIGKSLETLEIIGTSPINGRFLSWLAGKLNSINGGFNGKNI